MAERIAACCAAVRAAMAAEGPAATYAVVRSRGQGSDQLWEACRWGPFLLETFLEAYPCLGDDDAFGQAASEYVAAPSETVPWCSADAAVAGTIEHLRLGPTFAEFEQSCHTVQHRQRHLLRAYEETGRPATPGARCLRLQSLGALLA